MTGSRIRTPARRLLALLLALVLLVTAGCGPKFRLQSLSPESIPAEIRDEPLPSQVTGLVWRDYHEESGWFVAACTYEMTTQQRNFSCFGVSLYTLGDDGTLVKAGSMGSDLPPECFKGGGGHSQTGSSPTAPGTYSIDATGIAFHPRAAKVVGITSTGRTVEGRVVNGFWGLLVPNAEYDEWWTSVNATDADGQVLFRYWDGKYWQVGNLGNR